MTSKLEPGKLSLMNDASPLPAVNWKRNLLVVWLSQFLAMIGFGCCMPFIPLFLRDQLGIANDQLRGFYVSVYYFSGMTSLCIATAVWGILADRFGRKLMLLRASYAAALFYPLFALAPNIYVLLVIRFICSFLAGTVNPARKARLRARHLQHLDLGRQHGRIHDGRARRPLLRLHRRVHDLRRDLSH